MLKFENHLTEEAKAFIVITKSYYFSNHQKQKIFNLRLCALIMKL